MYYSVTHFQIHKNYELFVACIFKALLCILFTLKLELQFCTNFVKTFLLSPSLHLLLKLYWTALSWGQQTQFCCRKWWEISPNNCFYFLTFLIFTFFTFFKFQWYGSSATFLCSNQRSFLVVQTAAVSISVFHNHYNSLWESLGVT